MATDFETDRHMDCRNFAPVDVAKGICRHSMDIVEAGADHCDKFVRMPRCMHCAKYSETAEKYIGTCNAQPTPHFTYPDLTAVTCEWFVAK